MILLVCSLALSGTRESGEGSQSTPQKMGVEHENATKNVQSPTEEQPKDTTAFQAQVIEALRAIAEQQKAANEQNNPSRKTIDWVQIGLFIVGALYTFYAWRQWRAIHRQGDLSEKQVISPSSRAWTNSRDIFCVFFTSMESIMPATKRR